MAREMPESEMVNRCLELELVSVERPGLEAHELNEYRFLTEAIRWLMRRDGRIPWPE